MINHDNTVPIRPGSALDQAIDAIVAHANDPAHHRHPTTEELGLINREDVPTMVAMGTRIYLAQSGLTLDQLPEVDRDRWYGKGELA